LDSGRIQWGARESPRFGREAFVKDQGVQQIKKEARSRFARHRFDTRQLRMEYNKGRLLVRGKLMPLGTSEIPRGGPQAAEFQRMLAAVEEELNLMSGVTTVVFDIYEWQKVGSEWKSKE
jgi:hypothetical protein